MGEQLDAVGVARSAAGTVRALAARVAEEAGRAKSELLTTMSHKLRTPLQAITGFTELLGTLDLGPDRRDAALAHIATAAGHILGLVDDVLDIARIEARALPLHVVDVDLGEAIEEVIDLLQPLAATRRVSLCVGPLEGTVRADPRRLRQILINLVTNGVRYNRDEGWVRVTASTGTGRVTGRSVGVAAARRGPPQRSVRPSPNGARRAGGGRPRRSSGWPPSAPQ